MGLRQNDDASFLYSKGGNTLRLVGEDGFAAGCGEGADGAEGAEADGAGGGVVGQQEDAAGAGPEAVERGVVVEDGGGVWPEAAVPGAVDAAVDEVRGLAGVEEQGGAGGEFSVCLLYTSPSPRDRTRSRMPSSA